MQKIYVEIDGIQNNIGFLTPTLSIVIEHDTPDWNQYAIKI